MEDWSDRKAAAEETSTTGAPAQPDMMSLDRLKALDSLPDLASQLGEAQRLCTHSARAEMILRWLLVKLKASSQARQTACSWDVLASCARLLSVHRIAALYGLGHFLDIVQATATEPELHVDTMDAVTRLWKILRDLGRMEGGVVVLSLLSSTSAVAAAVYGGWMAHLLKHCEQDLLFATKIEDHALLDLAIDIWDLRKRQLLDAELFNSHCLLPASVLLAVFQAQGSSPRCHKRKRADDASDKGSTYLHALESAIAKHTILPARSQFFRKNAKSTLRGHRHKDHQHEIELEEALESIGQGLQREDPATVVQALPVLLDVALRAVPTPTPRHRIQERPWVEKLFSVLRDLVITASEASFETTAAMVKALRQNTASLPHVLLSQMASECIEILPTTKVIRDQRHIWDLVVQLVALDSAAFTNAKLAEQVFDAIASFEASCDDNFWRFEIILPIMRAFAQNRDFSTFVEIWHRLLQRSPQPTELPPMWNHVFPLVSTILGDPQTATQTLACIDRYSQGLSTAEPLDLSALSRVRADFIVLGAIVQGLRTDDLLDAAWKKLDLVQKRLFETSGLDENTPASVLSALWQLLASIFDSWFPHKVERRRSRTEVAALGVCLLDSSLVKAAMRQCEKESTSTRFANILVACLCARFCHYSEYDECLKACRKAIEVLRKHPNASLVAMMRYKDVLPLIEDEVLVSVWESATEQSSMESQALLAAIPSTALRKCVDAALSSTGIIEVQNRESKTPLHSDQRLIGILSNRQTVDLDLKQRCEVMNVLTQPSPPETLEDLYHFQKRLAIILRLLQHPCSNADLLTDSSSLWNLVQLLVNAERKQLRVKQESFHTQFMKTAHALSQLAQAVVSLWLRSRVQNRDKIINSSQQARQNLELCLATNSSRGASLLVAGTVIGILEENADDFAEDFAHRDPDVLHGFWKILTPGRLPQIDLCLAFEALLRIPRPAFADFAAEASRCILRIASDMLYAEPATSSPVCAAMAAKAARLYCRYADVDGFEMARVAAKVLKHDLAAADHTAVLASFESRIESTAHCLAIDCVKANLDDGLLLSPQALALQQRAVKTFNKEDLEALESISAVDLLHIVLQQANFSSTVHECRLSLQTTTTVLKTKPWMTNQFGVEQTISSLYSRLSHEDDVSATYMDVCGVIEVILTQYSGRLQGRYHLMVALFQRLITSLFRASRSSTSTSPLPGRQSAALSRLLSAFCSPFHVRKRNNLVDETRKAKEHAGQYVQYVLHHYCSEMLSSPPLSDTGVREALLPGLWAIIESIETNNPEDGIKSLSAAMNHSERAVLRSVYEEWQRRGKWEGT